MKLVYVDTVLQSACNVSPLEELGARSLNPHMVTQKQHLNNSIKALQPKYTFVMAATKIYFPFGLICLTFIQGLLTWNNW